MVELKVFRNCLREVSGCSFNRSMVELKDISPYASANVIFSFNRSMVELKVHLHRMSIRFLDSFNRSMVELKVRLAEIKSFVWLSFNRSMVELKVSVHTLSAREFRFQSVYGRIESKLLVL